MAVLRGRLPAFRWVALGLYLLVTLSGGFAHRAYAMPVDPLAEFVLPDGTRPVICFSADKTTDADGGTVAHKGAGPCQACRLDAAPVLPTPDFACHVLERIAEIVDFPTASTQRARPDLTRPASARGPPLFVA